MIFIHCGALVVSGVVLDTDDTCGDVCENQPHLASSSVPLIVCVITVLLWAVPSTMLGTDRKALERVHRVVAVVFPVLHACFGVWEYNLARPDSAEHTLFGPAQLLWTRFSLPRTLLP